MKKILYIILYLLVICNTYSQTFPDRNGKIVLDWANILTENQENLLTKKLSDYQKNSSAEIVIVTTNNSFDLEKNDYTYKLFRHIHPGKSETNNGILIVTCVDPKGRFNYIMPGYGAEGVLPDAEISKILRNVRNTFKSGDYYIGLSTILDDVITNIGESGKSELKSDYISSKKKTESNSDATDIWIIFLVVVLILVIILSIPIFLYNKRHDKKLQIEKNEKIRLNRLEDLKLKYNEFDNTCVMIEDFYESVILHVDKHPNRLNSKEIKNLTEEKLKKLQLSYSENKHLSMTLISNIQKLQTLIDDIYSDQKQIENLFTSFNDMIDVENALKKMISEKENMLNEMLSIEKECSELVSKFMIYCGQSDEIDNIIKNTKTSIKQFNSLYSKLEKYENNISYNDIQNIYELIDNIKSSLTKYRTMIKSIRESYEKMDAFRQKYNKNQTSRELSLLFESIKDGYNKSGNSFNTTLNSSKYLDLEKKITDFKSNLPSSKKDVVDWVEFSMIYNSLLMEIKTFKSDIDFSLNYKNYVTGSRYINSNNAYSGSVYNEQSVFISSPIIPMYTNTSDEFTSYNSSPDGGFEMSGDTGGAGVGDDF